MRRFNFRRSQELLNVDPKTFGRWLKQADIDPSQQIDRADPRQRFLTEEQLRQLADEHGRELPPSLDQEDAHDTSDAAAASAVSERLAEFEVRMTLHFQALETQQRQMLQILADLHADLQRLLENQERTLPPQPEPMSAASNGRKASSSSAAKATVASSPSRNSARKPAKKTKGKRLPRTLIPLHVFGQEHGVSEKATDHAAEMGKLSVTRGRWLYNSRYVTSALDRQGQHEFYTLFHERQGFQACKACPHAL
jgi:hypothetical protein